MQVHIETLNNGTTSVIAIQGDTLDAGNVQAFKESLQPVLESHQNILIDMSGLAFVDSSGLGALLSTLRTVNNKNGQLKLFAMSKPVQALFELVRMHRIFAIYDTRDAALATL